MKFIDEYVATVDDSEDEKTENGKANGDNKSPKKDHPKSPAKSADIDQFKTKIKDLLCRAVDHFDPNTVVDSRSEDFIANRLPPHKKATEKGKC